MTITEKNIKKKLQILRSKGFKLRAISEKSGIGYYKLQNINSGRSKGTIEDYERLINTYPEYLTENPEDVIKSKYYKALERLDDLTMLVEEKETEYEKMIRELKERIQELEKKLNN